MVCLSKISDTQVDNAKDLDIVEPMCNLIECNDNYFKTSEYSISINYFKTSVYCNILEMNWMMVIKQILIYLNLNQGL